jgi:hypothetical protein
MINTPKYTQSVQRSLSPSLQRGQGKGKTYSQEEVTRILKNTIEPKMQYLLQEIE